MSNVHLILQGKGGVGKSVISTFLAQYLKENRVGVFCVDTDPVNATFSGYKDLAVTKLEIMEGDEINTRKFDSLIEMIAEEEREIVIDNGSSNFVPFSHYLVTNCVDELLTSIDRQLVVHCVITGGASSLDTLAGFASLVTQFAGSTRFVIWKNPYHGPVEFNGATFEETKTYLNFRNRIAGIIELPKLKEDTYGVDLSEVLEARLTMAEALENKELSIMTRQRLKMIKRELDRAIGAVVDML